MDLIPRYLLVKALLAGNVDDYVKSLYARTILMWNGARERVGVFSNRAKNGVEEHIAAARALLEDMKMNGFDQKKYIPIGKNMFFDGCHRLAAAITLDEKIWVKDTNNTHGICDFKWFVKHGFDLNDQMHILEAFADIYKTCNIFLIFQPAMEQWDYIKNAISEDINIVGYFDLDFTDNFYAFENFINDIYKTYKENKAIKKKIDILKMSSLVVRVVLVDNEKDRDRNLYGIVTDKKTKLRDKLTYDIPSEAYCTLHAADSYEEFVDLKSIVFSYNNYKQLMRRVNNQYRNCFLDYLDELKGACLNRNIPISEVCIVGGGVLEAYGIRETSDIDIVVSDRVRKSLTTRHGIKISDNVEIVDSSYWRCDDGFLPTVDEMLLNSDYYFSLYGCKFANLELVKRIKESKRREKDILDIALISRFQDFALYFDGKQRQKEQMKLYFGV